MTGLLSAGTVISIPAPAMAAAISAPGSVTLTPGRRLIKVEWTAPVNPSSPVSTYTATASNNQTCTANSSTLTCTIANVDANVPLTVGVRACPAVTADCSATTFAAAAVKAGPPAAPPAPNVSYTSSDQTSVHLSWTPADEGAGIGSYRVTPTPAFTTETGTCTALVTVTACDLANLIPATAYTFKLTAIGINNSTGSTGTSPVGPASASKYVGLPGAPATPTITRNSNTAVTVSWIKPSGAGGTIAGYTVQKTTGGTSTDACSAAAAATACQITGLDPTLSYTFKVKANGEGDFGGSSAYSSSTGAVILGKPAKPEAPTVELGAAAGQVRVFWTAPDGGGTVTGYTVTPESIVDMTPPSPCDVGPTATFCDFNGLDDGVAYTFKVVAKGATNSDASDASASIVSQLPAKPNTPTVTLGNAPGSVVLSWTPASTGGPVIYYTVAVVPSPGTAAMGTKSADCGFNLTSPSCTITGLTVDASYTFKVTALGDLGSQESDPSTPAVVPDKPGAPTSATVTLAGPTAATINWAAPGAGTGGAVTGYTVTATPSDGSTPIVACTAVTATTCPFTGLDAAKRYSFKVRATNPAGGTDASATVVAPNIPSAPVGPSAAVVANTAGSAAVSWTAPASGNATKYVVTVNPTDGSTPPAGCDTASLTCTVTGLDETKPYTFTVRAENLLGGTDASPTTAITPAKPGAPGSLTVTIPDSGEATVGWTAPTTGGPVALYTVTATSDDGTIPSPCTVDIASNPTAALSCAFTGLDDDEPYQFTVNAANAVDDTDSAPTADVLAGGPAAPTGVQVALGDAPSKVTVSWDPATGAPVTAYLVTATSGDGGTTRTCVPATLTADSCTFTTLTANASYTFVVNAENAVDNADSVAVPNTPLVPDKPGAPTGVSAARGDAPGKATVTWIVPTSGGAFTEYTVTPVSQTAGAATPTCTKAANLTSCDFTTLTPAASYTFTVSATNNAGTSSASSTPALVPNKPDKPANVVVTVPTPGSARVVWDSPTGAPVTGGWTVSASSTTGGAAAVTDCTVTQNAARDCTLTGLTQAANYTVTVTAHNVAGDTVSDTVGPIVADNPNAPGTPTGEVLSGTQVRLTWTEPSAGGGPVAKYAVKAYTEGAPTTPISSTPCTDVTLLTCDFDGLSTTETYTFRVIALGPGGGSTTGGRSTPFTTALPAKPAAPTVALEGNAVRVTWTEPSGGPVVSYSVISAPDVSAPARCTNVRVLSCLFDRLHSGTPYTFKVVANGTAGRPVESDASSQITIPVVIAAPGAPGEPTAMASDPDRAFVSWTAPVVGGPVTKYTVNAYASGAPGVALTSQTCTEVTNLGCMFGGLTDTGTYTFRVTAIGPGGDTQSDPSFDVTTAAPGKPAVPTVQLAGPRSVKVSWVFPQGPGPISSFTVVSTPDLSAPARCTNTQATECVFDRLASGTSYTFKVRANGFFDRFTDSDASADIIAGPPGTMAAPTVAPVGPTSVNVYWAAPATGGSVTGYQVLSSTGNLGCAATAGPNATSCLVSGLTPGTSYTFTVKAQGTAGGGDSAVSAASAAIVAGAPAAPTDVEVAAGDRQIAVSWTAPTVTTGIVRYRATTTPGGLYCEVTGNTTTECVISGVQNLTSYTVTVTAVSANGSSPASAPSVRVRPTAGRPGAPTAVQAIGGNTTALVTWTAPTAIGNGIARYIATAVDSTGTQKVCSAPNTAVTCTIEGLTNGTPYSVSVAAVGPAASGISLPGTAVTVTPRLVVAPGVPTNVLVTMGVRSLTVTWSAGSAGDGLAGFTVTATPPTGTPLTCAVPATETSCTFTDVPLGPYAATVVARGTGTGVVSAASTPYWGTSLFAAGPTLPTLLTSVPASSGTLTGLASSASAGGSITITGGGFAPWTGLSVYVYAPRVKLATIVADANGAFSIPVGIPPTTATGSKTIVVAGLTTTGGSTIRTLTGTFTLQSAL